MRTPLRLSLVLGLLVAGSSLSHATRKSPLEGQPSIRHRVELRQGRFEATPYVGFTLLQDFHNTIMGGARLAYHIFDWLAIGGTFAGGTTIDTGLKGMILDTLHPPGTSCGGSTSSYMGGPPCADAERAMNYISWIAAAEIDVEPFGGKFSLFSKAFPSFDFYLGMGVGFVGLKNNLATQPADCSATAVNAAGCNEGIKLGPTGTAGIHVFFNNFMALNLEYRALIIKDNPAGRDVNRDLRVNENDLSFGVKSVVSVGLSFFLPASPDISR